MQNEYRELRCFHSLLQANSKAEQVKRSTLFPLLLQSLPNSNAEHLHKITLFPLLSHLLPTELLRLSASLFNLANQMY